MTGAMGIHDKPVTTPAGFEEETRDRSFDRALVYQTSGTTGEPKRIPYGPRDIFTQAKLGGDALSLLGVSPDDALLNLCAPDPHISGALMDIASMHLGTATYNNNFEDFSRVLELGKNEEITTIAGSPFVTRAIAQRLGADGPAATELFPNIERIISVGTALLPGLRDDLKRYWGADEVRNAYASTEFGCIAVSLAEGEPLAPLTDYHQIELLPTDTDGDPIASNDPESLVPLDDLDEPTIGILVISNPDREVYPLIRYRTGDRARVTPTADGPRFELLGREDDAISFGGALLYEEQIAGALRDTYGEPIDDWRAIVTRADDNNAGVTVYVLDGELESRQEEFREAVFDRSGPVKQANDLGLVDHLDLVMVDSIHGIDGAGETYGERLLSIQKIIQP